VIVILAEKKMRMEMVQALAPGSIIEFRKLSGELLDLCVGRVKIAEGEVVLTNEHFGIQVRKLIDIRAAIAASAS
jgi:flagellar motor switch protein FliN/FliY